MEHEALTRAIIGCAMMVHRTLGPGFLESVYENALTCELRGVGISVDCGRRLQVRYRDAIVGEFVADLVVADAVLVELKAIRTLASAHEAQLMNYLAATGIRVGLLVNFGSRRLEVRRRAGAALRLQLQLLRGDEGRMTAG
jgi:GxxExxY protein